MVAQQVPGREAKFERAGGLIVDRAPDARYTLAVLDWLACAYAGVDQRAARAVRSSGEDLLTRVAFAATAGHVHDFDDTLSDGVAHVSATTAPAALVVAGDRGLTLATTLAAYAEGFEAMAALARSSHPALYERGWHPTAVCGPVGAAVAAARLLELTDGQREHALRLALLRTGGVRGAFGSDGKAIQVGLAAASGVQAALLARGGAEVSDRAIRGAVGFEGAFGAVWPRRGIRAVDDAEPAIAHNWIKLYPSCLGTHAPIEAAAELRARDVTAGAAGLLSGAGKISVRVHSVARQAAHLDGASDGLEAKFSIPYCVAFTLQHGPPRLRDFARVDPAVGTLAKSIRVEVDPALPQFGCVLMGAGLELAQVPYPTGAPERPLTPALLHRKLSELGAAHLAPLLDDLLTPASRVCEAARLQ
jgi:2-methylcitrate dehydratase PrpD